MTDGRRKWLLDLNFTLVANSHQRIRPFLKQIAAETYRQWLIEDLRQAGGVILLVTARPAAYREATLARIAEQTGWQPDAAFFNTHDEPPPVAKRRAFLEQIVPRYGEDPISYFAIESNPLTRAMYQSLGVGSCRAPTNPHPMGSSTRWTECIPPAGSGSTER